MSEEAIGKEGKLERRTVFRENHTKSTISHCNEACQLNLATHSSHIHIRTHTHVHKFGPPRIFRDSPCSPIGALDIGTDTSTQSTYSSAVDHSQTRSFHSMTTHYEATPSSLAHLKLSYSDSFKGRLYHSSKKLAPHGVRISTS